MLFRKEGRSGGIVCHTEGCGYRREADAENGAADSKEKPKTARKPRVTKTPKSPVRGGGKGADDTHELPEGFEDDRPPIPGDDDAPF